MMYAVSINRNQRNIYYVEAKNKDEARGKAYKEWNEGIWDGNRKGSSVHEANEIQYGEPETDYDNDITLSASRSAKQIVQEGEECF